MTSASLFTPSATAQYQATLGANTDGVPQTEGQALYQQASQSPQPEAVVKRQFEQRNRDQKTQLANEFIASAGREGINDLAATPDGQHALAVIYEHADRDARQIMREVHDEQGNTAVDYTPAEDLTDRESEVMIGLAQMTLDLVGIVDPTPISDVGSAALSITQGDWVGVFISGLSIVPYIGDLAKLGKLGKWAETVSKAVDLAINNAEYAKKVEPLLKEIGEAIGSIPESAMRSLPEEMQKSLKEIKQNIDKLIYPEVDTPKSPGSGAESVRDGKLSSIYGNKVSEVDGGSGRSSLNEASRQSEVVTPDSAANRAIHETYKTTLKQQMSKPHVENAQLQKLMDGLYRQDAKVGSGSTADAIRHELATGEAVGGRLHTQKGMDSIRALEKWLTNNPSARPGDRAAAENVILDLRNALGE